MLHINHIRKDLDSCIDLLSKRNFDFTDLLNEVVIKDEARKKIQQELERLLQKSNELSRQIGDLYKSGDIESANELKTETKSIKEQSKDLQQEQINLEDQIKLILENIPNIPHHSVSSGKSEDDNKLISQVGKKPELMKDAKPHWELAVDYNLINFDLGAKITGAGFPVYIEKGARLQRALISYFLDKNINAGYVEYLPPHLVNHDSAYGTGQLPKFEDDLYKVSSEKLYLIPTAEVPITNLFRNVIIKDFPVKCTSYTPCFRQEAGSYGKDVRGLNRLHQFDKVEIVQIQKPSESYKALNEMVDHVSSILDDLELPYRIVQLCGGDLGFSSALTYDFEVYSAAQKKWLEVSSVSNFESFQANRLKLRYKENTKMQLCHTLNGSALALPRIFAALIENNQTKKGITIPEALHSYTGFDIIS